MSKVGERTRVTRRLDPELTDLRGFAASIAQVSVLAAVLALAYTIFGETPIERREWLIALIAVFVTVVFGLRLIPVFQRRLRSRLAVEAVVMVLFVTALTLTTGGAASPLIGLYILPLVVAAIVLGYGASTWMLVLVFVSFAAVGTWQGGRPAVPDAARSVALLLQFAPLVLVTYLTLLLAQNFKSTRRQIHALSERDDLTELYNMRAFTERLEAVHADAGRSDEPYGLIMIDVDALKPINDEFGHEAGNRAIQLVARAIQRCTRGSDVIARYGGDEFIVLLPHSADDDTNSAIRRIRNSIYATTLKAGPKMVRISVSIGLASYPKDGKDPAALLNAADKAMYLDKASRRERERKPEALKNIGR